MKTYRLLSSTKYCRRTNHRHHLNYSIFTLQHIPEDNSFNPACMKSQPLILLLHSNASLMELCDHEN